MTGNPTLPGLNAPTPPKLSAACELLVTGSAGWQPCPAPAMTTIPVGGRRRRLCPTHTRQLPGLAAAGLLDRLRWATSTIPNKEGP
jgi:hypothetical protein